MGQLPVSHPCEGCPHWVGYHQHIRHHSLSGFQSWPATWSMDREVFTKRSGPTPLSLRGAIVSDPMAHNSGTLPALMSHCTQSLPTQAPKCAETNPPVGPLNDKSKACYTVFWRIS